MKILLITKLIRLLLNYKHLDLAMQIAKACKWHSQLCVIITLFKRHCIMLNEPLKMHSIFPFFIQKYQLLKVTSTQICSTIKISLVWHNWQIQFQFQFTSDGKLQFSSFWNFSPANQPSNTITLWIFLICWFSFQCNFPKVFYKYLSFCDICHKMECAIAFYDTISFGPSAPENELFAYLFYV